MKKILLITNRLVIGGPSRHVAMIANRLQDSYEVLVVGGGAAPGETLALDFFEGLKNKPILIEELSRKLRLTRDYKVYRKLRKIIHEFQPDIVHTHTSKVGALGRMAAKKEGVRAIFHTYHGLIFENYFTGILNKGLIQIDRYLARFTAQMIVLSVQQKNSLVDTYKICSADKISLIPLAIDIKTDSKLRKKSRDYYGLKDSEVFIGVVGRLVKIKNLGLFLKGVNYLMDKGLNNFRVLLVGDGDEKENLIKLCKSLNIPFSEGDAKGFAKKTIIHFASWQRELAPIYAALDMVVLTSLSEGTPMSLMEAQITGNAVLASNVGGVSDIVPNGKGLLFDIDEPQSFNDALYNLVSSAKLRKDISEQAQDYALKSYSVDTMMNKLLDVYQMKADEK
ncbi:MAG: hypothetical protein DSY76_06420 [Bacteroidetes bacterium]|nr:MAG: hypothetical protein DSY76_06420 [Bacteroidota bacterium]